MDDILFDDSVRDASQKLEDACAVFTADVEQHDGPAITEIIPVIRLGRADQKEAIGNIIPASPVFRDLVMHHSCLFQQRLRVAFQAFVPLGPSRRRYMFA
jgi:hypothetical protein